MSTPAEEKPCLTIRDLSVELPDGRRLLKNIDLTLRPGEVIVLLGGSGSGKSTLGRVLFEPRALRGQGFTVQAGAIERGRSMGLVPQRGALIDHLDVGGNIRLALRHADPPRDASPAAVASWLDRVDLDRELGARGTKVGSLSGGQAQRVAVARTLAAGRQVLFLDEPSVGLDPARVRTLARQIRRQVEERDAACIVVTHDVALAAGVADRLLLLDPDSASLVPLLADCWPGPLDSPARGDDEAPDRSRWQWKLEQELVERMSGGGAARGRRSPGAGLTWLRRFLRTLTLPFAVAASGVIDGAAQLWRRPLDYLRILLLVLYQALLRPAAFYGVVSMLLGYTVLYVISGVAPMGVPATRAVEFLGSSHIVALVPPVCAFLFVAASGNAVNGWLGGMSLTRQIAALEALGIPRRRYLWAPAWLGVGLSSLAVSLLFALGMAAGGALFCHGRGIADGWAIVTTDFFDPRPERAAYLFRAAFLVFVYAWGIAADVVAAGTEDKAEADHVTRSMTGSVVRCTLWVVTLELISTYLLFATRAGG